MLKKFIIGTFALALILTAVSASAFSGVTLRQGSKGADVKELQTILGLTADGSFGPMTAAKVKAWQANHSLVADGVVGPKTFAAMSGSTVTTAGCPAGALFNPTTGVACTTVTTTTVAGCAAGAAFSSTTGAACTGVATVVSGGAGNIASATLTGSPSSVQVGEGAVGTNVLGFQVRADAGSDLNIQNVRVNLVATGTGSTWPSRYITGLAVWKDGVKVGTVGVASLSQNGTTYNATVALTGAVIKANSTSNFTVSVDANTSIDSNDAANAFNVYVDSIRYSDGTGAILTSNYAITALVQPMRFLKLSASASTKLVLSEDATNPKDRTVTANYTSTTNDVSLLKFNLKAQGSNMIITKMVLPVTATGSSNASDIAAYYKLKYNGSVVSSFTIQPAAGLTPNITFGDTTVTGSTALNGGVGQIVLAQDQTGAFEVVADVKAMNTGTGSGTTFDSGDTLKVDYPWTNLSTTTTVQDQTGAALGATSTNRTGSATGYAAVFRVQGVSAAYVGNTFTPTKDTNGVLKAEAYTTTVTVSAVGNDFFINPTAIFKPNTVLSTTQTAGLADTSAGFNLAILNGSNQYTTTTEVTAASVATSVTCTSGCSQQSLTSMKIPANTTATFVISTTLTDSTSIVAGGFKVAVFGTNATDGTTMVSYPNTPVYNFITPISPDSFQ